MRYFFIAMIVLCALCVFGVNLEDAEATEVENFSEVAKFSPVKIAFVSERKLLADGKTLVIAPKETTLRLTCLQKNLPELQTRKMFISQGLSFFCKVNK